MESGGERGSLSLMMASIKTVCFVRVWRADALTEVAGAIVYLSEKETYIKFKNVEANSVQAFY